MSKYGVKIDIGEQEYLWITQGLPQPTTLVPLRKTFETEQEAIDYCKQVWSGAWVSGRAIVEKCDET